MPNKNLPKAVLLIHGGFLIFGIVSFKFSKHEFGVLDFVLKYLSLPTIILSIMTMRFLVKSVRQADNLEKKQEYGLVEKLKTIGALIVIGVVIEFSYFLGIKSFIELTNQHIGRQETFKITGQIIEKSSIHNRKEKTFYLKVQDSTDKVIEIRVKEDYFNKYKEGDTFLQSGKRGSLGFIYTE